MDQDVAVPPTRDRSRRRTALLGGALVAGALLLAHLVIGRAVPEPWHAVIGDRAPQRHARGSPSCRARPPWTAARRDRLEYRIAGPSEPDPGSVLYGVRIGTGCLVGWVATERWGWSSHPEIAGVLPAGTCLRP